MATRTMEPVSTKLRPDEKRAFLETCDSIGTSPSNVFRQVNLSKLITYF